MGYDSEYSKDINKMLSKDRIHRKLTGVCAGIAKYYGYPRIVVRIAAVLVSIILPIATVVTYVVASLLLPSSKYN